MHQKTREKYLKNIITRIGKVPEPKHIDVTDGTAVLIKYVLSFLPKKYLKYAIENVYFHEPHRIGSGSQAYATCVKMNDRKVDFVIMLDSYFRELDINIKFYVLSHEIGHVFVGNDSRRKAEINEQNADDFALKYFSDNKDFMIL
jgi:hypothetical protein